ncbi:molybdopterin-binding protein [Hyphomicrobium sp.]|uniref:molybdopterin-binding protein n=1 Tax=Hyphomicrobium sp. TaxID=82 RepID=UPI000FAB72A2|nr:molybdopterin-binding protein [Hyphomicrobium sp.]RUO99846.1 MAG: molybdopterin-binding protein [Hyphomicrobium sp.]
MADARIITRRAAIVAGFGAAGYLVANTNALTLNPAMAKIFEAVEDWTRISQRALLNADRLAPEYRPSDISPVFKANGTLNPNTDVYNAHAAANFSDWRLNITGLVSNPMSLSLADIRRLPARTQITKHDCVEGWTAIGMWTGVQLGLLLKAAGMSPQARYVVFHCADNLSGEPAKGGEQSPGQYYESIDLKDAFHPQTLIAYALNGNPLDVPHGAPLRLRVERQLGYKHAKYIQSIQVTDSFANIAGGRGGYWEDRGYEWYAGI